MYLLLRDTAEKETEKLENSNFISEDFTALILSTPVFAYSQTQLMNPLQISGGIYVNTPLQSLHSAQAEQQTTSHIIK